jgi:nitrate reductase alpha subunit
MSGQEKLRPQTGWAPLAFALDWHRPPRQHELDLVLLRPHRPVALRDAEGVDEILSPTAARGDWDWGSLIDYNVRAERMGWLPSAPQLKTNPLEVPRRRPQRRARIRRTMSREGSEVGRALKMSCEDPDDPENWPRNMFVWRSNLLGSSGKGHEYFLKHLLGTRTACRARIWARTGRRSRRRSSGTTRRRKESSTCW